MIEHRHIDEDVYNYGHTLHCTRMIIDWPKEWKYGKNSTTVSEHSKSPGNVNLDFVAVLTRTSASRVELCSEDIRAPVNG